MSTPKPAERFQSYIRGWRAGAAVQAMDPKFAQHPTLGADYNKGYTDGREAYRAAAVSACDQFSYKPNVLRIDNIVQPLLDEQVATSAARQYERTYVCGHLYTGEEPPPRACQACMKKTQAQREKLRPGNYNELTQEDRDEIDIQLGLTP